MVHTRSGFKYRQADYTVIKKDLCEANLLHSVCNTVNVNEAWSAWYTIVMKIIRNRVPKHRRTDKRNVPWVDKDVIMLRNKRNTVWRSFKRTHRPSQWIKYKHLRNALNKLLKRKYKTYVKGLGHDIRENPRKFCSFFNCKRGKPPIPTAVYWGNRSADSPRGRCTLMSTFTRYLMNLYRLYLVIVMYIHVIA